MKTMRINKYNILNIGITLAIVIFIALGCDCNFSVGKPKEPTNEELTKLVKETMKDFTDSVEKDDFEIIRKKASKNFQKQFSADQIKNSFSVFVEKKNLAIPLFQEAQSNEPEFSPSPTLNEVNKNYILEAKGNFPAQKQSVNFHFEYLREEGKWKLIKIEIKT